MINKYKIHQTQIGINTIQTIVATTSEGKTLHIPIDEANIDYQQFKKDVVGIGTTCVEGADYVGVTTYTESRAAEYPSWQEQQDMQYWDAMNGTTTWKDKITEIKNKYPKTQIGITSIAELPDWVVGLST